MLWQEHNFPTITSLSRHCVITPQAGLSKITSLIISQLSSSQTPICFSTGCHDCALRAYPHMATKLPNQGTIQQPNVSSSHLFLVALSLKVQEKNSLNFATSASLNSCPRSGQIVSNPEILYHIPLPVSVYFDFWIKRHIILNFNDRISQQ